MRAGHPNLWQALYLATQRVHSAPMNEPARSLALVAITFALLLGAMWWAFDGLLDNRSNPNRHIVANLSGPAEIELRRGPGGHYRVPGTINGQNVAFLVDTGASDVVVPERLAERLGLTKQAPVTVSTAGGRVTAHLTRIDRIMVGGIAMENIGGVINPAADDDEVLLGMSFLRHLEMRQANDRLMLRVPD